MCALQLCPDSDATLEVMSQLGRWGEHSLLRCFQKAIRAVWAGEGRCTPLEFARQVTYWRRIRRRVLEVSRTTHQSLTMVVPMLLWGGGASASRCTPSQPSSSLPLSAVIPPLTTRSPPTLLCPPAVTPLPPLSFSFEWYMHVPAFNRCHSNLRYL